MHELLKFGLTFLRFFDLLANPVCQEDRFVFGRVMGYLGHPTSGAIDFCSECRVATIFYFSDETRLDTQVALTTSDDTELKPPFLRLVKVIECRLQPIFFREAHDADHLRLSSACGKRIGAPEGNASRLFNRSIGIAGALPSSIASISR